MKISESKFNPLQAILEIFDKKEPEPLTVLKVDAVALFLEKAGVSCDTREEVLKCLKILEDMGILLIQQVEKNKNETQYKIGNLYNGK